MSYTHQLSNFSSLLPSRQNLIQNACEPPRLLDRVVMHERDPDDPVLDVQLRLKVVDERVRVEMPVPYSDLQLPRRAKANISFTFVFAETRRTKNVRSPPYRTPRRRPCSSSPARPQQQSSPSAPWSRPPSRPQRSAPPYRTCPSGTPATQRGASARAARPRPTRPRACPRA